MSGTSMDGVDAVLLDVAASGCRITAATHRDYSPELGAQLRAAITRPDRVGLDELGQLDVLVGEVFAAALQQLLAEAGVRADTVRAVGSHGQTLRHQPHGDAPFTLQIGDPNVIAERSGIDVVADFRRRDIAAGGEAAPLVPAFHAAVFGAPGETRVVVNIGGIANITVLAADGGVTGFDTGPGNCLMDVWVQAQRGEAFDRDGALAAAGRVNAALLERLLAEPYLQRMAPKSTGRELFQATWLEAMLAGATLEAADVQATLCEYTARTIRDAIVSLAGVQPGRVLVCGGGTLNPQLMQRLAAQLPGVRVASTAACGIDPMQVEAAAFAWLAHRHIERLPGNLPAVTGARGPRVLGATFPGAVTQPSSDLRMMRERVRSTP